MHKHHATLNNPKVGYGDGLLCFLFVFEKLTFRGVIHRTYRYSLVYCRLQNDVEVICKSLLAFSISVYSLYISSKPEKKMFILY